MKLTLAVITFCFIKHLQAQQIADTTYAIPTFEAKYKNGAGPIITIDEAHYNFHTANGRYSPFCKLLEKDGYSIERGSSSFTDTYLQNKEILVISNALNPEDTSEWIVPNPSAFTSDEIKNVNKWVQNGGSLFLIADHMPFAGAAADLATSFGVTFYNGFALDSILKSDYDLFTRKDQTLLNNELTAGIDSIVTFTGQAFDIPPDAHPILRLSDHFKLYMCEEAWKLTESTVRIPGYNKIHLAYMNYGKGKIVFSGEAAMFTAQKSASGKKTGMNSVIAKNNYKLLLSLLHWLSEKSGPGKH